MNRLTQLGLKYGTDKATYHGFTEFYSTLLKGDCIKHILEIGVFQGASLRMWREYFPKAHIMGFDVNPIHVPECSVLKVDSGNREQINITASILAPFDLIIDDGGHTMKQQQVAFDCLWPHLSPGGIYIIEDIHTSQIPQYRTDEDAITTEEWIKNNFNGSNYATSRVTHVKDIIWWARHKAILNDSRTVAILKENNTTLKP
jgi:predicted O-methyltransferase YrrM